MQAPTGIEGRHWFVLNYIIKTGRPSPANVIDAFNKEGESRHLELFAPIIRPASIVKGKVVFRDRLLTYNYIFVKGNLEDVKKLCASSSNDLSLMLNRGSARRYAILTDQEMESFKIIARVHTNTIPFFNIEDIKLEEGDKVEVVGGDYAGLKGVYMPKSRSNKGNLVIAATADMGAVLWDIDAKYLRILEFAPFTRRQYDLIDSFIPKLLPILRKYHSEESLTVKEKNQLSMFNRRMCAVSPNNHKVEAKLLATLMCVQTVTGDLAGYRSSAARFEKRKAALTNPWTIALVELMLSVALDDMPRLREAYLTVEGSVENPTKTQQQLLDEFKFYLHN